MPGMAVIFNSVIDEMTRATDCKLVNMLHVENSNLKNKDRNTSIEEPQDRWNMHLVSYHTDESRAKLSSNGQLSCWAWSFGIFDESHQYKTKKNDGWQIAMNERIGF
jgi:hypothetical protein